jgi:hypothetical protein
MQSGAGKIEISTLCVVIVSHAKRGESCQCEHSDKATRLLSSRSFVRSFVRVAHDELERCSLVSGVRVCAHWK